VYGIFINSFLRFGRISITNIFLCSFSSLPHILTLILRPSQLQYCSPLPGLLGSCYMSKYLYDRHVFSLPSSIPHILKPRSVRHTCSMVQKMLLSMHDTIPLDIIDLIYMLESISSLTNNCLSHPYILNHILKPRSVCMTCSMNFEHFFYISQYPYNIHPPSVHPSILHILTHSSLRVCFLSC